MAATPISSAAEEAANAAVLSIGLGYDLADPLRLKYCKKLPFNSDSSSSAPDRRLIVLDDSQVRDLVVPGAASISIPNVPNSISFREGECTRLSSDVLSFQQMSEQFNQELSLSGKIPSGRFNAAFDFTGSWQYDEADIKTLAFDGIFITLYNVTFDKSQIVLSGHVKQAVPSSWDPAALARFIEIYGTHIIVGVKMGGEDVLFMKQQYSSPLQSTDAQKKMKDITEKLFTKGPQSQKSIDMNSYFISWGQRFITSSYFTEEFQDIIFNCKRKGGHSHRYLSHEDWFQTVKLEPDVISMCRYLSHEDWFQTVQLEPDVISMSFIPIASLLMGIPGSGFLSHAINLYLCHKPPIEELHTFLDFQIPRQWAPIFGELTLGPDRKMQRSASLQFSFMGPKLYVNTVPVDVGRRPVTGLRLYLEGKTSNCLAIHLQHLSAQPKMFQLEDEPTLNIIFSHSFNSLYFEAVQWKNFSHVCTAPIELDDDLCIVTGAHFEVGDSDRGKVLFLRLHFSKVISAMAVMCSEWDASLYLSQKYGIISTLTTSTQFSNTQKPPLMRSDVYSNSGAFPGGPPVPSQTPKPLKFVDTAELTRGPRDWPGYWVVSGAQLVVEKGKICIRVKYSLLTSITRRMGSDTGL